MGRAAGHPLPDRLALVESWHPAGARPAACQRVDPGEVPALRRVRLGRTVVYARVSAHHRRSDLDRQVSHVVAWASRQQLAVDQVVTEVGSALDGRRPKLARLLADPQVTTIVVEHGDRLGHFGVEQVQAALSAHGRRHGRGADRLLRPAVRPSRGA
jgi:putative resolvase